MKKALLAILAVGLLAASCKKDMKTDGIKPVTIDANAKKYKVNFAVSQFSQTVGNIDLHKASQLMSTKSLAADTSTLSQAVNQYYYIVYDSNGKEVKRIFRTAQNPGFQDIFHEDGKEYNSPTLPGLEIGATTANPFNVITDSLAAGTYSIVVTGSNKELGINNDDINDFESDFTFYNPLLPPLNRDSTSRAAVYVGQGLDPLPRSQEIFFGKVQITVGNQNSTQSICINRIVGQLELNLEESIPNNVAYIGVVREGELEGYLFYNEVPFGYTILADQPISQDAEVNQINASDRGKPNYKTDRFVVNTVTPINVKLIALDASFNVIVQKTIHNVRIYKNKRTIISGKLFSTGPASQQFTINANQAWAPDAPVIHF
jgi:hypothetical protein